MAKKMGVAPSILRYYDKEGLLPFVERSGGGIRMFKDEDIGWLSIIECLKKTGMPIKEIKRKLHERMNGKKNKIFAVFHGKALKCATLCVTIADINDGTMKSRSAETGGSFSFSPPK